MRDQDVGNDAEQRDRRKVAPRSNPDLVSAGLSVLAIVAMNSV